jgi:sugar phosphate isomerase/epimerase
VWQELFQLLAEKGYGGVLSYEAPNPALWERSPYEVAREGVAATRALLAAAAGKRAAAGLR